MARHRQERAIRTRRQLLEAAAEVFDESGYAGANISHILERAGVTAGAMYFHFASKEALAKAVVHEQAADLEFPQTSVGVQQLIDMTGYLAFQLQRNTLLRAGVRLAVEQSEASLSEYSIYEWWIERFHQELKKARILGQLRDEVDEMCFARVLVAAFTGTQIMSRLSTGRADLPDRIGVMWHCLLPALCPPDVVSVLELPACGEKAGMVAS